MALQHKLKLFVYRELKQEVEFEDNVEHIKGVYSRLRVKLYLATCIHGLFGSWVGMLKGMGPRNVPVVGLVSSLLSMLF